MSHVSEHSPYKAPSERNKDPTVLRNVPTVSPMRHPASEQARRDALAERNEQRNILHQMLSEPGRGGLSQERAVALEYIFKRKPPSEVPRSERGLARDARIRLEGLAEMAITRLRNSVVEAVAGHEDTKDHDAITPDALSILPCTETELDNYKDPRQVYIETMRQPVTREHAAPNDSAHPIDFE